MDLTAIIVAIIGALATIIVSYWRFVRFSKKLKDASTQQANHTGRVVNSNTGYPVREAKVSFEFQNAVLTIITDSEGIFKLPFLLAGFGQGTRLRIEALGYQEYNRFIELSNDHLKLEDISLKPSYSPALHIAG